LSRVLNGSDCGSLRSHNLTLFVRGGIAIFLFETFFAQNCYNKYIVIMIYIRFEWDEKKNRANIKKHNISFEEAKTVFYDENARLISDPVHSNGEDRFILLGISRNVKILIVVHVYKEQDELIRIISARKATKTESKNYFGK